MASGCLLFMQIHLSTYVDVHYNKQLHNLYISFIIQVVSIIICTYSRIQYMQKQLELLNIYWLEPGS